MATASCRSPPSKASLHSGGRLSSINDKFSPRAFSPIVPPASLPSQNLPSIGYSTDVPSLQNRTQQAKMIARGTSILLDFKQVHRQQRSTPYSSSTIGILVHEHKAILRLLKNEIAIIISQWEDKNELQDGENIDHEVHSSRTIITRKETTHNHPDVIFVTQQTVGVPTVESRLSSLLPRWYPQNVHLSTEACSNIKIRDSRISNLSSGHNWRRG